MSVLGKSQILAFQKTYHMIHPFDMDLLDGDSYILTVGKRTELNYMEHRNLISREIVFLPPTLVAHLTAKSRFGRAGLSFLNAAKVHSGFLGRLALEVVNLNNDRKPIAIGKGEPFMHIEFLTRAGDIAPYEGEYQFQYMSPREIARYTPYLKKAFPNYGYLVGKWGMKEKMGGGSGWEKL